MAVAHCYTVAMATIAHRELRNDSAEILRRAASGESFEVTNNGRVVAMVVPPAESALERYLQARLLAPPSARSLPRIARVTPARPSLETLDELKGDR